MTLFVHAAAEDDILRQVEWYGKKGLPAVARRFYSAAFAAMEALGAMPAAGPPRIMANPRLTGLRTWPLKGFDLFRVYYLEQPATVLVLRVLHDKRDVEAVLGD